MRKMKELIEFKWYGLTIDGVLISAERFDHFPTVDEFSMKSVSTCTVLSSAIVVVEIPNNPKTVLPSSIVPTKIKYKKLDKVVLLTGGPVLLVIGSNCGTIYDTPIEPVMINVTWFDAAGVLHRDNVDQEFLKPYGQKPPPTPL
jgi:hypothetical protein